MAALDLVPLDTPTPKPKKAAASGGLNLVPLNAPAAKPTPAPKPTFSTWHDPRQSMSARDPAVAQRQAAALEWAADSPVARGVDAALNTRSRSMLAGIGGQNPGRAAIDPAHATDYTQAAERNIGKFVTAGHDATGEGAMFAPHHEGGVLGALQGVEDFVLETAASGGGKEFHLAREAISKLAKAAPVVKAVAKVAASRPVRAVTEHPITQKVAAKAADIADRAQHGIVEGHDLRKDVRRPGEDIVKNREAGGTNNLRRTEQHYAELVDKHRDALDAYDAERSRLQAEINEYRDAAKAGSETAVNHVAALRKDLEKAKQIIPADIRTAMLQRAYREGTPEVRRQVMSKGYRPTEDDRANPPLNILHNLNDEYEPTQRLYDKDEVARTEGPVRYATQGNKRASFDLPKEGGTPDTPLADRVLDRLTRGARLENYHGTRRAILNDLGITSVPEGNPQRTLERLMAARTAGDGPRVAAYESLLRKQNDALAAAEQRRAIALKPGATAEGGTTNQNVERVDPRLAQDRAYRDARAVGNPEGMTPRFQPGPAVPKGVQRPAPTDVTKTRATPGDLRYMAGRESGLRASVQQAEGSAGVTRKAAAKAAEQAATATGLTGALSRKIDSEADKATAAATRLHGRALDTAATTEARARRASNVKLPASGLLGPDGRPVKPGVVGPPPAAAHDLVGPNGRPMPVPLPAEKKAAQIAAPSKSLAARIGANVDDARKPFTRIAAAAQKTTPGVRRVLAPIQTAANRVDARMTRAVTANERAQQRLAEAKRLKLGDANREEAGQSLASAINTVPIPKNIHDRLYGSIPGYNRSLAAEFSDLQRDALFVVPFAHMKNIAVLQSLGPGGPRAIVDGMKYAHQLRTNPEALAARVRNLEDTGATEHYIQDADQSYAAAGPIGKKIGQVADYGNRALERYDLGMRLALEDTLKKQGMGADAIAGQIRDVLGDYKNQAPFIKELRDRYGANFPAWRLGAVPRAMTKAARERPGAVATYARAERLGDQDVSEPTWGVDIDPGGPVEDASSLAFPRLNERNAYTSESTIGWPRAAFDILKAASQGKFWNEMGRQGLRLVPGGPIMSDVLQLGQPSNEPVALRVGGALVGSYAENQQSIKQRAQQLHDLGIKGEQFADIMRSEGYYGSTGAEMPGGVAPQAVGAPSAPAGVSAPLNLVPVAPAPRAAPKRPRATGPDPLSPASPSPTGLGLPAAHLSRAEKARQDAIRQQYGPAIQRYRAAGNTAEANKLYFQMQAAIHQPAAATP